MKKNNEIKWAIAVAAIMLTVCFIAFTFANRDKKQAESIDLKVYKLIKNGDNYKDYTYQECKISTDNLVTINKEFNRVFKLEDKNKVTGTKILGEYKIESGKLYLAFDTSGDAEKVIYRNDTSSLYEYNSNIYKLVSELCK